MIACIMPVWIQDDETLKLTEASIESIKFGCPECKMVIVDNASTFGRGRLIELADLYIKNSTNLGYAKAVNQGMKLSGDLAVIANNDILVSPNWWSVTQEIITDPQVATIHFRMIPYGEDFKYGDKVFKKGMERWCTGSFFVKTKVAYFDERYLNSYDDWDYQVRARSAGYYTTYTTKACYQHKDSHTQKKIVDNEREVRNQKNREYFLEKHGILPEDLYMRDFPDQMIQDWRSKFDEL